MSRAQVLTDALRSRFAAGLGEGLDGAVLDVSLLDALRDPADCLRRLDATGHAPVAGEPSAVALSRIILVFCQGFHLGDALPTDGPALEAALAQVVPALRGFAYEGVAASLAIQDYHNPILPSRLHHYVHGVGARYGALVGIGAGVTPVFRRTYAAVVETLGPRLWGFAVDGFAYREAFLYRRRTLVEQKVPEWLEERARRPFDHGVGRGVWFTLGGQVDKIESLFSQFPQDRQPDLWSGVGFASTYTGAAEAVLPALLRVRHGAGLRGGAALGVWARVSHDNATTQTDTISQALWGRAPDAVASAVEQHLAIPGTSAFPPPSLGVSP